MPVCTWAVAQLSSYYITRLNGFPFFSLAWDLSALNTSSIEKKNKRCIPRICALQMIPHAKVIREEMTQTCFQLACSVLPCQCRLQLNLCLSWKAKPGVSMSIYFFIPVLVSACTPMQTGTGDISALCTRLAHISLQVLFRVIRVHSQEHLGCAVQISTPGFWPLQSSTGLMSGRKQGFPPLLQGKRPQFGDP